MKYIIFMAALMLAGSYWGQTECDHNVSTNYQLPTNDALLNGDTNYRNRFNWNAPVSATNPAPGTYQLQHMQYNQNMLNLMDINQPPYYQYIYDGDSLIYKNGWELLLLNIGRYPNNTDNTEGTKTDLPYIVLYNRYTGIIRIFANYGEGFLPTSTNIDAVNIVLMYDSDLKVNGMLRLQNGSDLPLDQATLVKRVGTLAKHPNAPGNWFSGDIQVAYDPCVCYYPSRIRLNFQFIKNESIELHGRSISIEQDLINGTAITDKEFLSNFNYNGETADGGMVMYKALSDLTADYYAKLEKYEQELAAVNKHNTNLSRAKVVLKLFEFVALGGGKAIISEVANQPWFQDVLDFGNDLIGDPADTLIKKKQIVDEAKKGFATQFGLFMAKNFSQRPTPTSPSTPTATFTEMHFNGLISDTIEIAGPNVATPGTYGSIGTGTPALPYISYPIYNDVLGTFALLTTPVINISKTILDPAEKREESFYKAVGIVRKTGLLGTVWGIESKLYQNWTSNFQFQLANELKYAFNSTLDIVGTPTVQASLVVKAKPKKKSTLNINTNTYGYIDPTYTTNYEGLKVDVDQYEKLFGISQFGFQEGTNHFYQGTQADVYYGQTSTIQQDVDTFIVSTPFVPIDAFKPVVSSIGLKSEEVRRVKTLSDQTDPDYPVETSPNVWSFPATSALVHTIPSTLDPNTNGLEFDFELELKLLVDMEFATLRSDGTPNKLTQILTYKLETPATWATTDIHSSLEGSELDFGQYPFDLTLNNSVFNGTQIEGCKLNGTTYTCRARNDVYIRGALTTANSYNVKVIAGNMLYALPESSVSPEIVLSVDQILDYSQPMPQADQPYVKKFCKDGYYKANKLAKKSMLAEEVIEDAVTEMDVWNFNLFPNPATGSVNVKLTSDVEATIELFDITGKRIDVGISKDGRTSTLDISTCERGMYLVRVSASGGAQTKQLVIQ